MNKTNEFVSFLNSSLLFSPDYDNIKYRINEEQFKKKNYKIVNITKYLKIAVYTVFICILSIFVTISIKDGLFTRSGAGDVSPLKLDEKYLEENFDNFYAFGSGSQINLITIDIIINSNLIDDSDKEILKNYKREYKNKRNYEFFNLYLGEKNGKDIIILSPLGEPKISFTFKSNLNYTFNEVKKEFEDISDKKLTKEFLYGSKFDNTLKREIMGIIVSFKKIEEKYIPYYTMELDGKIYIIDK